MKLCFFCGDGGDVRDFDEKKFEDCYLKILFRKEKNFKYGDLKFSVNSTHNFGYHRHCLKKITVLKEKYQHDFEEFYVSQTIPKFSTFPDDPGPSTSSTIKVESCTAASEDSNINIHSSASMNILPIVNEDLRFYKCETETEETNNVPSNETFASVPKKHTVCIFCGSITKRVGKRQFNVIFSESQSTIDTIFTAAQLFDDIRILSKLDNQNTVPYHAACFSAYIVRFKRQSADCADSDWHSNRDLHKKAFNAIRDFIEKNIMKEKKVFYLTQLLSRYKALLLEFGEGKVCLADFESYRAEHFEKKILTVYGDRLIIEASTGPLRKKIVYDNEIDISMLASETVSLEIKNSEKLEDVAYELRERVKKLERNKLPNDLLVDDIIKGECDIPKELYEFISNLIEGPDVNSKSPDGKSVKVISLCSDIIYAITKGRTKPSKHLTLGLAMKSLTNSRKVLTILNRYGHTVGYNLIEELETEMTYTSLKDNSVVPLGIDTVSNRSTHVAFDNFDRFVDTSSGKDTMHDTVGIIYQFRKDDNEELAAIKTAPIVNLAHDEDSEDYRPTVRKRRFEEIPKDIQPYYSKSDSNMKMLSLETIQSQIDLCKGAVEIAVTKDLLWILSLAHLDSTPMWLGFNCKIFKDNSELQTVEYLPPINESPTSKPVVYQTLQLANEIAETCNQEQIIVTYDLAIAKIAMQIQENESPKFDNIFINLGAFHMQMAFFKAIGKYIESSGLVDILVEAKVLAAGSMNSFLDSKHFNRCKRIHPLTSAALQMIHLEQYLTESNLSTEMLSEDLQSIINSSNETFCGLNDAMELPELIEKILHGYRNYCEDTISGKHGKTAQFYLQYCEFINLFLRLSRSIRSNNFELYLNSIFEMSDLFFTFNQPNYARWAVKYLSNLINLQIQNSPLVLQFRRGTFGIRRTKASFARSPVDLTLEQTVNADAENQLTRNYSVNSISARQRWALNHSMRTKILTFVKNTVKLCYEEDSSRGLQKSRIDKDRKTIDSIIEGIKNTLNPFDTVIDKDLLFNISTGRAAPSEVANFLLNVKCMGSQQKSNFISECSSNSERFKERIKSNKILNFASICVSKSQKSVKDIRKKVILKMERDIFGRLLAISLKKKIDIERCLMFPLAPLPPALFSCTGEMYKTDKSALAKILKQNIEQIQPPKVDIEIIDGFYYLHLIGSSLPKTFDKVAESILVKLCSSSASEIHIIFDRYLTDSIKSCERQNRKEFDTPYSIKGPLQPRPNDFLGHLKNYHFKNAVVKYLSDYWENDSLCTTLANKKVFITVEEKCFSYRVIDNHIIKTVEEDLICYHEEADTRIMFHINKTPQNSKILVKATDTDVLIILLGNIHKVPDKQIWLAGSSSKKQSNKDLSCFNCTELASKLDPNLCLALPAFHAFTGSDYTAAFYNKGKARPFKIFSKNPKYQKVFAMLTDEADLYLENKIEVIQEFTCLMYGVRNCLSVNEARYRIFMKSYGTTKNEEKFLKKIQNFDSTHIPPCWKSLKQKILRTIFVNSMWLNATESECVTLNPENYGWFVEEYLKPRWFFGDPTPLEVEDIVSAFDDNSHNENSDNQDLNNYVSTSDESDDED